MDRRIVTAAQMKEIERAANERGIPYLQMMENAGLAAYAQLRARFPQAASLLVVCGKGNNGGDGFVLARAAALDGWQVTVLLAEGEPKTPDAITNYARLEGLQIAVCRDAAALEPQALQGGGGCLVRHRIPWQSAPGRTRRLRADTLRA